MLTRRQIELLMLLLGRAESMKGREIADHFHVTSRTVRNDIQEINAFLKEYEIKISADKKEGYFLSETDSLRLRTNKIIENLSAGMDFELPQTGNERVVHLLCGMLFGNEYSIEDIEDLFYISSSAAHGDLKALSMLLNKKTFLKLHKEGNIYSVEGEESVCRSVISGIYTQRRNVMLEIKYSRFITGDESFWNVISFLTGVIMEYCESCGFELTGDSVYGMAVDIALTYQRNKQGFFIEPQEGRLRAYGEKLRNILCEKDAIFQSLNEDDWIYLQERLTAKEYLRNSPLKPSEKMRMCLESYCGLLSRYGISVEHREEVLEEMERILYRYRHRYYFNVTRKHEIFDNDPASYYMAQILKYYMEKAFPDLRLTKSESAVLSTVLRNTLSRNIRKTVIVSDASRWIIDELKKTLESEFGDYLQIDGAMSHYAYEKNRPECDCVISTEPLDSDGDRVIVTGRTLNERAFEQIRRYLRTDRGEMIVSETVRRAVSFEAGILEMIRALYMKKEIGSLDFGYIEKNLYQSFIGFGKDDILTVTFPLISANHLKEYIIHLQEPFEFDSGEYKQIRILVFPMDETDRINQHLRRIS